MKQETQIPELLSPAGDWESLRAAVANGADAVYFGLSNFNARHRAANFTPEELPETMAYLHRHNVRGYVAFNTLIFSDELPDALEMVRRIAEAGVDAIIVQDLGLAKLVHRFCPTLPLHGSTQMTLTEAGGIEFARSLGVERVILARELSIKDIERITQATSVPVEVFVHGALCVSYSGQCLTSEALGGRSANRGQCAQACRLPYELIVDGDKRDLGDKSYLLSPQDLAAYELIGDLARLGVRSLKIEGRLKSAHYVAAATQTYRGAIDAAARLEGFHISGPQAQELAQSFSRGFSHGFLDGVDHQELVHARFPKSRGIRVGQVAGRTDRGILIELAGPELKSGDGLVFDQGHPEQDEQGGRIFEVQRRGKNAIEATFGHGVVSLQAIEIGSTVWKTDDPAVRRKLQQSFARDRVVRPEPVTAIVRAIEGEKLRITFRDISGHEASAESERTLEKAEKFPLTMELLREQLGRLGDTPFRLESIEIDGELGAVMVPKSVLNDLRRRVAAELALRQQIRREIAEPHALENMRREIQDLPGEADNAQDQLYVLARTIAQVEALAGCEEIQTIYCEFEDVSKYPEAVRIARRAGKPIGIATMRIVKPGEEGFLRKIADCEPDCVLVRNLAGLAYFARHFPKLPLVGDYALNAANEITAHELLSRGMRRLTPSYDLNWKQLAAMLHRISPASMEAVIHQHMPMFHLEHCVFCHVLSSGKDYRDCGRPCEKHQVDLRDRAAAAHPLVADAGCRNTVYNGIAQSAAEYVPEMQRLGIRHFRVELLRENGAEALALTKRYARVIAGIESPRAAWRELRVLNQLGVTRGTLEA